jgi:hypothetical protein
MLDIGKIYIFYKQLNYFIMWVLYHVTTHEIFNIVFYEKIGEILLVFHSAEYFLKIAKEMLK